MDPTEIRLDLARRAQPAALAAAADPREAVLAGISSSYFRLRRGMAVIALALPPVLWLGAGAGRLPGSISAYYHFAGAQSAPGNGIMRDVFVGALWTIGAFLFFYRGYSRPEDRALNVAGIAAIVIALVPMDWPPGGAATLSGRVHGTSAVIFFLVIAYVALFRSVDTVGLLPETARQRYRAIYRILGSLMVVLPLTVAGLNALFPAGAHSIMTWAIEVSGILVFAVFWLVKSREIAAIEGHA